jgi:hypothetical protein
LVWVTTTAPRKKHTVLPGGSISWASQAARRRKKRVPIGARTKAWQQEKEIVSEAVLAREVELRVAIMAGLATRAATQREATTAGEVATTPDVKAATEEAAPAVAKVRGNAAEEKAEETRAELAVTAPIGLRAVKAESLAEEATVVTPAVSRSAEVTTIVEAQHAAPLVCASNDTKPRTKEVATEIGAAVAVDQA